MFFGQMKSVEALGSDCPGARIERLSVRLSKIVKFLFLKINLGHQGVELLYIWRLFCNPRQGIREPKSEVSLPNRAKSVEKELEVVRDPEVLTE